MQEAPDSRLPCKSPGLLGVSISEDSSDELEGTLCILVHLISAESQLFLAFRGFLGSKITGDRSTGWIRAWYTEDGGVKALSSAGICRKIASWSITALQAVSSLRCRHSWLRGFDSSAIRRSRSGSTAARQRECLRFSTKRYAADPRQTI